MQPRLLAISGSLAGTSYQLIDGHLTIGRDSSNHLCLADPVVSRKHCTINPKDQGFEIIDLDSQNGTFVNGIPIAHRELAHGDTIRIGTNELVFMTMDSDLLDQTTGERAGVYDKEAETLLQTVQLSRPSLGTEVGHMARDLHALFRISSAINSIRDITELQRELLSLIAEAIPAQQAAVVLLTDLEEEPTSICAWHRNPGVEPHIQIQRDLLRRAIWEQSVVAASAASESGRALHVVCSPLIGVEKTIGVIYLICTISSPSFGEDHIHFLGSASRIAAVTLENVLALNALRSENQKLKQELNLSGRLIGESRHIQQVEKFVARVAPSDATVLIRGESGTGKEVVARAIHEQSPRADRPFVAINCAAIPDTLFESELFGYEKGAFTGATALKKGKFEAADDGTLFLDEIGELPPPMQAKLLRVLQQKEFERVGGTRLIPFKARVIAATNRNLEEAIRSAHFRQDLYYRLNVVSTSLLPLRERREDIPLLALFFASRYAQKSRRPFKGISQEARALMMRYSWPGNVRELENAIEHAIVLGLTEEILPEDLPSGIFEEQSASLPAGRYQDVLNKTKKDLILASLREAKGSFPEAAHLLGVHPKYLHRLVRNLNLKSELR